MTSVDSRKDSRDWAGGGGVRNGDHPHPQCLPYGSSSRLPPPTKTFLFYTLKWWCSSIISWQMHQKQLQDMHYPAIWNTLTHLAWKIIFSFPPLPHSSLQYRGQDGGRLSWNMILPFQLDANFQLEVTRLLKKLNNDNIWICQPFFVQQRPIFFQRKTSKN